jgi:hypothetical protein
MPLMEDIEMQKSDFALATTHYEVKLRIINLVVTTPLEDWRMTTHIDTLVNQ